MGLCQWAFSANDGAKSGQEIAEDLGKPGYRDKTRWASPIGALT